MKDRRENFVNVEWPKWGILALDENPGFIDLTDGARAPSSHRFQSVETYSDGARVARAHLELFDSDLDLPPVDDEGRYVRLIRLSARGDFPPSDRSVVRMTIVRGMNLEEAAGAFEQFSSMSAQNPAFEAANLFRMMEEPTGWVATGFYAAAGRPRRRRALAKHL